MSSEQGGGYQCHASWIFFSILRSCRRGVIVQAVSSIFLNMLEENMPPLVKEGAMSFCSFCSEKLKEGRDIYIYQ